MVVLNGCPPTVSSLLQRMGRGNRRRDYVMAFGLYESDDERRAFENLFTKAIGGELEDVPHSPCISVALQQTFSVLFQNRRSGIDLQQLKTLLGLFEMSDAQWNELIAHLEAEDYLEESRGKLFPSQKLLDLADKGRIHSNISSAAAFNVVSNNTGETLGEIGYLDAHYVFLLVGGMYSRVVRVQERSVYVEPVANATVANTNFPRRRNRGEFYWMLPQTLRAISEC